MNVDKRKTVHFFNDRSNQVVFSSVGNLYRIFSAVCSPYCLCCSISVRLSPGCRMLSGRWKSWVSGSNPGGMQSGFSPCTAHFTIRRECPATASVPLCPVPADVCPPGRGFARDRLPELPCRAQETPALRPDVHPAVVQFPLAAWRRIFSYQTVDKTLTFHFLRATLELPTGQYWPRGNICLGGSLCRKLKKKR